MQKIIEQAPSLPSKDYGKPFLQIFREADRDFYKIDHGLFVPAILILNNAKTGRNPIEVLVKAVENASPAKTQQESAMEE